MKAHMDANPTELPSVGKALEAIITDSGYTPLQVATMANMKVALLYKFMHDEAIYSAGQIWRIVDGMYADDQRDKKFTIAKQFLSLQAQMQLIEYVRQELGLEVGLPPLKE